MRRALIVLAASACALTAPAAASAASDISLKPTAGRYSADYTQSLGNATGAQAQWTNKQAESGKFSVLLQKSVATTEPSYAGIGVKGVEGRTVGSLGSLGFSVKGGCTGGSPRINLAYDVNGDGQADGVAFYGCANHITGQNGDWTHVLVPDATLADNGPVDPLATVVSLAIIVDEQGTYYVDNVIAAGQTAGEPNGGS